jgi:putative membrane protein
LRRLLTSSKRRATQARAAAEAAFQRCHVHQTRAQTGVLIYVSLLEREVEVIADSGASAGVPNEEWAARVGALRAAANEADPAEAILKALENLGEALAKHLPGGDDNPDELADEVRGVAQ